VRMNVWHYVHDKQNESGEEREIVNARER